ncbi:MAG: helix-turn-helix transcriptional regulator [Chitinophagaceae bacterium]|nr:helix-turn-helix transcriptional regulator [Chitinophagaceae bacterium]
MKAFDEIDEHNYNSDLIDEMLSLITPEMQAQAEHKMRLAAKIYKALKAKGWKSQDLANAMNLKGTSLVSKWLSGTHNFTVETLVSLQRLLDIQLLNIDSGPTNPNSTVYDDFSIGVFRSSLNTDQPAHEESGKQDPTVIKS